MGSAKDLKKKIKVTEGMSTEYSQFKRQFPNIGKVLDQMALAADVDADEFYADVDFSSDDLSAEEKYAGTLSKADIEILTDGEENERKAFESKNKSKPGAREFFMFLNDIANEVF